MALAALLVRGCQCKNVGAEGELATAGGMDKGGKNTIMTEKRQHPWLFGSLFLGGFECSSQLTSEGQRLDLITATQHDQQAATDYARCQEIGIHAVREAARWPFVDWAGKLNLSSVEQLARLGRESGLIQIWDLMHYGYPDDLEPFSPAFVPRFVAYCQAVAAVVRAETQGPTYYTPINEISYYAWAGGEVGYMAPFLQGRGGELKRALVRAAIAGINAIWEVDPEAQILNVDPLVRQHPPAGRPDLQAEADFFNQQVVSESFDLLAGQREPELGGSRRHLGIVGLNFYAGNQWTMPTPEQPRRFLWREEAAWVPLSTMLAELQTRYGGPLVVAETGASGAGRAAWLRYLTAEVGQALLNGVDVGGICLYPIITSPDWEDPTAFFDGGVFDVLPQTDGTLRRVLVHEVAAVLREAQLELDPGNALSLPVAEPEVGTRPLVPPVQSLDHVRFKSDNFVYQTLLVGEQLTLDLYCLAPGGVLPPHRYAKSEQVWTVLVGSGLVWVGSEELTLVQGSSLLIPAGVYHMVSNVSTQPLVIQRVCSPKAWDARFAGAQPAE